METSLIAMSAAAPLTHPFLPPVTGAEGTAVSGVRPGAFASPVPGAAIGRLAGLAAGSTDPAYTPAFSLITGNHTDATQVPPRGRPV